jgi:hypothetical protein
MRNACYVRAKPEHDRFSTCTASAPNQSALEASGCFCCPARPTDCEARDDRQRWEDEQANEKVRKPVRPRWWATAPATTAGSIQGAEEFHRTQAEDGRE